MKTKILDALVWQALAGRMAQVPRVNSKVFYCPQGHAEHAFATADFAASLGVPPLLLCRVSAVELMVDLETEEVFAKISLVPLGQEDGLPDGDDDNGIPAAAEGSCFVGKVLTQSDSNNGGGFSVPKYLAETVFPKLDYLTDSPCQQLSVRDVHGEVWEFKHIYRGSPRRHLLTTGWSVFVNKRKLVAGDSVVFVRDKDGNISVGIKRGRRTYCNSNNNNNGSAKGVVSPQDVLEAVTLAANGKPFDVVYYPRDGAAEFCVRASAVRAALGISWSIGMRFKMPSEDDYSSRISWSLGTIASVSPADPIHWPNSPWRFLQVSWDEPDLKQNVQRVNPWLIELISNAPMVNFSSYSPPGKKLRLAQQSDFTLDSQYPALSSLGNTLGPSNPLCYPPDNTPVGIQGARHVLFGVPLLDLQVNDPLQLRIFPPNVQLSNQLSTSPNSVIAGQTHDNESLSSLLTVGNSSPSLEKSDGVKTHHFILFGHPIVTEQQGSPSSSGDAVSHDFGKSPVDGNTDREKYIPNGSGPTLQGTEFGLDTGRCKVFMESEDAGWTLDLSVLGSYEELYRSLADLSGIERSEMLIRVLYYDATGAPKRTGDEPFSDFMKKAKRLTILASDRAAAT
ncbi:auxin response factor 18 [Morus notabilis]|uniref:auxin response factor 18 n=1 Tax=Morus notabilis TaxID=981085 RepID=UPI000CED008A|nr:auxin response factor 18 [Morus notabilis]